VEQGPCWIVWAGQHDELALVVSHCLDDALYIDLKSLLARHVNDVDFRNGAKELVHSEGGRRNNAVRSVDKAHDYVQNVVASAACHHHIGRNAMQLCYVSAEMRLGRVRVYLRAASA
jgi:hypothetical protein